MIVSSTLRKIQIPKLRWKDLLLAGCILTIALSIATMICGWYGVGTHGIVH